MNPEQVVNTVREASIHVVLGQNKQMYADSLRCSTMLSVYDYNHAVLYILSCCAGDYALSRTCIRLPSVYFSTTGKTALDTIFAYRIGSVWICAATV